MVRSKFLCLLTLLAGLILSGLAMQGGAFAQSSRLTMLDGLQKGEWTVRVRESGRDRKLCVRTGRELIQLRHRAKNCNRFVVEDGANQVTVQYTCPGAGYGRTSIRKETNNLVQIESQGIASGLPYQFQAEARRTGACN